LSIESDFSIIFCRTYDYRLRFLSQRLSRIQEAVSPLCTYTDLWTTDPFFEGVQVIQCLR